MFGRNNQPGTPMEPQEIVIPEPRTLIVNELVGPDRWEDRAYQGHNIQTTECGGLNILRIAIVEGVGPVNQMVVGLPPGYWRRIHEEIDLRGTSRLAIN